jgi:AcrR family transcriptional regulator|tara:strand:+ start:450 stop:1106 length:657 start_codon:yes stop_codon:yes gene_type:complete
VQTRKATNRTKLIKAAASLIERDGYKNIDVTKVTKEAKLGYGTFYNHFSDITQLFEEITKEVIISIQDYVIELTGHETSPLKQIFIRNYFQFHAFYGSPILEWVAENPTFLMKLWDDNTKSVTNKMIKQVIKEGELEGDPIELLDRFENIRETYRWNFLGSLHSLLAGKDPDIAFVDNSEGVDIFSMPYNEKREFLTSIVSDYKKHSAKIQKIFLQGS